MFDTCCSHRCTNNAITMTTKLFPFNDASAFKTFDFMLHDGEPNIKEMVEQRFFALRKGIKGPAAPEHVRRSPRLSARKSSRKTAAKRLFKYSVEGSADTLTISSIDLERMSNPTEFLNDNCIDFFIKVRASPLRGFRLHSVVQMFVNCVTDFVLWRRWQLQRPILSLAISSVSMWLCYCTTSSSLLM